MLAKGLKVLHDESTGFLVERRVGKRLDQEAPDDEQDMSQAHVRLPVPLEHIDANLAGARNVGVEYLGDEHPCCLLRAYTLW